MENPIVVVGSGISGLNFALKMARKHKNKVIVLTKKETAESGTNYAQGGIAAVLDQYDTFKSHINDTLKAGSNHNKIEAVELIIKNGPAAIKDLIEYGVNFQTFEGRLALTREGGHSANRIAFVGDYTGRDIERALVENVRHCEEVTVIEHASVLDLALKDGKVIGVWYWLNNKAEFIGTSAVVMATGGIGQLYKFTTNPNISTGDGIAMAIRAGAKVKDMEFVQFHPTAFIPETGRPFLISEAVRGEGAYLVNNKGERFVDELAPRDKVSQSIFSELRNSQVYLDCRHIKSSELKVRFPTIYEELSHHNLKMDKDLIPIAPAAHYLCGGIETDLEGSTNVNGLYAFGECAYTGLHGANRLASNSLLEALVISSRLADKLGTRDFNGINFDAPELIVPCAKNSEQKIEELKNIMWSKVGIVRNNNDLKSALEFLDQEFSQINWSAKNPVDLNNYTFVNMLQVGQLITKAALAREESLGCHLRIN